MTNEPAAPSTAADAPAGADIRAYLEIRTSSPSSWAPDGSKLLISSDLSGTSQVHRLDLDAVTLPVDAQDLVPLTRFAEPIGAGYLPAVPPGVTADDDSSAAVDGDRLLLATDVGGNERYQLFTTPDTPDEPLSGPDDLDPLVLDPDHIHRPGGVSRDGRWLAYATNRGDGVAFDTWVRDLTTGTERCVFASGGWTGPGGFSPDGRWLAVTEVTTVAGDNIVHLLDLDALDDDEVAGPDHPAVTELAPHTEGATVGTPSWLPDSSGFVFATDVDRQMVGIAAGTPDGDWEYVIEPGWDAGASIDWTGSHLLVVVNDDGRTRAALHDPHTYAHVRDVPLPGSGVAGGFRFSRDGRELAFQYTSPLVPGDAWRYRIDSDTLERLTVSPCDVDPSAFVDAEKVRFRSFDDLEVPAFVFTPPTGDGPFPVVVMIHGGPEAQYRPSFAALTQYLVAQGFAVVAPNVRGSTGYGRDYQHLDDVEKRLDSVRDLAALHAWITTRDDLDADRAALYGGSYGGYMVLAGLAFQPELWAAGVDIVGMSDLVTFLENTSEWRRAFREREYGSLEHDRDVLEAASPINRVRDMRAPLFIVHGANDPRVPLSEAEQIHAILQEQGVRTELRVYDDEGHGLSKLANRIDCYPRIAAFLHEVLDV
jgi:dipeptidyl aminopeptidase/acylaminoacyl peptidase